MRSRWVRSGTGHGELALDEWEGHGDVAPFVLVHGLASNARMWDGVAAALAARGHGVVAVDLLGHGRSSSPPPEGYGTTGATDDVAAVLDEIGGASGRRPVVVGQSWGGNVVVEVAVRHGDRVAGIGLVDGGWIELCDRFSSWDDCVSALSPPAVDGISLGGLERRLRQAHPDWPDAGIAGMLACYEVRDDGTVAPRLRRATHLAILRSLWEHRPSTRWADVRVPAVLIPAASPGPGGADLDAKRAAVERAACTLARARVHWLDGDHDLHAQHPDAVASLLHAAATEGFFS